MADAVKEGDDRLRDLEQACAAHRALTGHLDGRTELLTDVLRDCCTRRSVIERLDDPADSKPIASKSPKRNPTTPVAAITKVVPEAAVMHFIKDDGLDPPNMVVEDVDPKETAMSKVKKVPDFNIQEQSQVQMQEPRL